jgi:hypothetical protein
MKFNNIEEEKAYLFKKAKTKFRSIRNSGCNTQKEYEDNIQTARWCFKKYHIQELRHMPMCGPSKWLIRRRNKRAQRVNL